MMDDAVVAPTDGKWGSRHTRGLQARERNKTKHYRRYVDAHVKITYFN